MKVSVVFLASGNYQHGHWPASIQMELTAGIFLASILLKEMRYLVYRYRYHRDLDNFAYRKNRIQ